MEKIENNCFVECPCCLRKINTAHERPSCNCGVWVTPIFKDAEKNMKPTDKITITSKWGWAVTCEVQDIVDSYYPKDEGFSPHFTLLLKQNNRNEEAEFLQIFITKEEFKRVQKLYNDYVSNN